MSPDQLLEHFYSLRDVQGIALLTHDGVLIASSFEEPDSEQLAALASQFLKEMSECSQHLGLPHFRHLSLRALRGTLFFVCIDQLVLLVVGKPSQESIEVWSKIDEAISALPRLSKV